MEAKKGRGPHKLKKCWGNKEHCLAAKVENGTVLCTALKNTYFDKRQCPFYLDEIEKMVMGDKIAHGELTPIVKEVR